MPPRKESSLQPPESKIQKPSVRNSFNGSVGIGSSLYKSQQKLSQQKLSQSNIKQSSASSKSFQAKRPTGAGQNTMASFRSGPVRPTNTRTKKGGQENRERKSEAQGVGYRPPSPGSRVLKSDFIFRQVKDSENRPSSNPKQKRESMGGSRKKQRGYSP